jgi:hypothetical protein
MASKGIEAGISAFPGEEFVGVHHGEIGDVVLGIHHNPAGCAGTKVAIGCPDGAGLAWLSDLEDTPFFRLGDSDDARPDEETGG